MQDLSSLNDKTIYYLVVQNSVSSSMQAEPQHETSGRFGPISVSEMSTGDVLPYAFQNLFQKKI